MSLRIRENATIHRLEIPDTKLEKLQKILDTNPPEYVKRKSIKDLTEGSPCCSCDGIPTVEVRFPATDGGATIFERYCEDCAKKIYHRLPRLE